MSAILAFIFTCTAAVCWTFNGATLLGIIAFATFSTLAYKRAKQTGVE